MTERSLDARLRRAAELGQALRAQHLASGAMAKELRALRAAQRVDLSPAAIDRRLREVEELRRLCLELGEVGSGSQIKP